MPSIATTTDPLQVAVAATVTAPPHIPDVAGSTTPLPESVRRQINELLQYPSDVPLSVSISPDVVARLDPNMVSELASIATRGEFLSQPLVPLDPAAASAANQNELFTDLLQAGEDTINTAIGARPTRTVWIEDDPLTTDGVALLRSLGVTYAVISPETYEAVGTEGGYLGAFTMPSLLREIDLGDGIVPAAVTVPGLTRHLLDTAMAPELAALYTAAELVAWHAWIAADFAPVRGHSLVLINPDGGVLGPDRVSRLVQMATATGVVEFSALSQMFATAQPQRLDGNRPARITLAERGIEQATTTPNPSIPTNPSAPNRPTPGEQQPLVAPMVNLSARADSIMETLRRQVTIGGMLVDDGGRTARWQSTLQRLMSTSVTDTQVTTTLGSLGAELTAISSGVRGPDSYTFTMNGQSTNLHPKIENRTDEPLLVLVHFSSSQDKIEFLDNDLLVELPPNDSHEITVRVRARSNGTSTITVQV
ncbi:MAG TPA: hypothetical protein PLV68_09665, partial [Ilumatobacteraceae bacterium]|nr:hypothetical protein [Ilumatobacteraceae bacterium]